MTSEDQLIERIVTALRPHQGAHAIPALTLRLGIGDDAAVIAPARNTEWVLSSDAFLQGIHFLADAHPADSVGYKALARATSDLAAMGATPRCFLLTLALPRNRTGKWLDEFLGGLRRAAHRLGMTLIGGDTTRSPSIFISITVVGDIAPGLALTRSGARPGDLIYVSGILGAAQLGLLLVRPGSRHRFGSNVFRGQASALKAHLYPAIRIDLGAWLARHRLASAMIDLSDGLSTDLSHLCAASGVGARIWTDQIPCVTIPVRPRGRRVNPLELALKGGEDYELLFTISPSKLKRLGRAPRFARLRQIGEIVPGHQITLIQEDGEARPLAARGWDPFRSK